MNAVNRPHQIPLEINLSYVRICHAPAAGRWSPPPSQGWLYPILTPPPCLRSYVEFVPGSTCKPAGHGGSSVLAGNPHEPDSGRKRRRRKPPKWDRSDGNQRTHQGRAMHAADMRWTPRRSLPSCSAAVRLFKKFYASSWPTEGSRESIGNAGL